MISLSLPFMRNIVASPPSSTIRLGPLPSGHIRAFWVHYQYSYRLSPFQAKTFEDLAATIAAAAWFYVLKILHEHHLMLSAPHASRVSIKQAVWIVIWRDPVILAPFKG